MSKAMFLVTYTTVTPGSAETGDYAECGFAHPNGCEDAGSTVSDAEIAAGVYNWTLSSVLRQFGRGGSYDTGDSFWLNSRTNFRDGSETSYILHLPRKVTDASHARIARALGAPVG